MMNNIEEFLNFSDSHRIWRILISGEGRLVLETRDPDKKEVFFSTMDLKTREVFLNSHRFEEKFWIGLEDIYKDKLLLHKYEKPDMPGHESIIAADIKTGEIIWSIDKASFLFVYDGDVYGYRQLFESREFYSFDLETGEMKENFGSDYERMNRLKSLSEEEKNFSKYVYPERSHKDEHRQILDKTGLKFDDIVNDVEVCEYEGKTLVSFHLLSGSLYDNYLIVHDDITGKILLTEKADEGIDRLMPESYFIYDNLLILIKDKVRLMIYKVG